ncbi:hypothetical protein [Thiobacillus sedimenti]|uniref:Uncharacterized protein n=1 Tax=Thiobacillus sedimenti TaxID=3110231 RepID=A0ABZ1CK37_9PROT|nr:hypothetical protein [Thiobacillus sp. SCUT-2]WRS39455.1 hypothetical protein VA613_00890 [Thiobacillus sp. SCUT-2]
MVKETFLLVTLGSPSLAACGDSEDALTGVGPPGPVASPAPRAIPFDTSALQGRNARPPKGANPALTDADVRAAVDHLAARIH